MYLKKKSSSGWQLCIDPLPPSLLAVIFNRILGSGTVPWSSENTETLWNASGNGRHRHCICQRTKETARSNFNPYHLSQSHLALVNNLAFQGPCKESITLVLYMRKQDMLKARRRWNSSWADAQPIGTIMLLEGASTPLTAPAWRHLLMLQQVFEVNHLHNDLDVLLGSGAEVMLQVALPL